MSLRPAYIRLSSRMAMQNFAKQMQKLRGCMASSTLGRPPARWLTSKPSLPRRWLHPAVILGDGKNPGHVWKFTWRGPWRHPSPNNVLSRILDVVADQC